MTFPVQSTFAGIVDSSSSPASSVVTVNQRVSSNTGPIGVISDVLSFSGASVVGNWVVGTTQVQILGLPAINQVSTGMAYSAAGAPTGPIRIQVPNNRVAIR